MISKIPNNDDLIDEECSRYKEDLMVQNAIAALERRMFKGGEKLSHPKDVENYLRLQLAGQTREVLSCIYLDSTHQVLAYEPLFYGTIDTTSVHPRVILQRALEHHCAAVIMAHNHPSGDINPSGSDLKLTKLVRDLLLKIDVRLLDHFIIGKGEPYSFAAAGCI
ncbi:JAB domain-containing protein [Pseudomonas sp. lyk4-TYG-107]|uniref:JAB domain-containing protein n=1 Tax=Pseudomonas sp. lyk4-TYG-107 TaxID=3040317 RepID=UPI002555B580|nr:JAB domain-containing protein [Pseudomonas sp. lyk4-TYG-107]